jgi:hypothetical protein
MPRLAPLGRRALRVQWGPKGQQDHLEALVDRPDPRVRRGLKVRRGRRAPKARRDPRVSPMVSRSGTSPVRDSQSCGNS